MIQSTQGPNAGASLSPAPGLKALATSLEASLPVQTPGPSGTIPLDQASCKAGKAGSYSDLDFDACMKVIDHSQDQAGNIGRPGSKSTNSGGRG